MAESTVPYLQSSLPHMVLTGAVPAGQGHCTLARQHLQFPDDLPCVDLVLDPALGMNATSRLVMHMAERTFLYSQSSFPTWHSRGLRQQARGIARWPGSTCNSQTNCTARSINLVQFPALGMNATSRLVKHMVERTFPYSQSELPHTSLTGAAPAGQGHCTLARQHLQFPDDLPCVDLGSVDLTVQQMEGLARFLNQHFEAGISLPPAAPALSSRSAACVGGLAIRGTADGGAAAVLLRPRVWGLGPSAGSAQLMVPRRGASADGSRIGSGLGVGPVPCHQQACRSAARWSEAGPS